MLAIIIGFIIGLLVPVQTSVNTRLRGVVGSPFLASLISFSIGSLFLLILVLLVDGNLTGLTAAADEPYWIWAGGVLGVIYLTGNILLFPRLGGVQTVIMPIFGQVIMGLLIDHFGLFEANVTTLSLTRIIGATLVLLGVVGTVALGDYLARRHKQQMASTEKSLFLWRVFGILTGTLGAAQTAINGHLGSVLGSAVKGALISFVIGTIALLLLNLILRTKWQIDRSQPFPAWVWIGGLIGALFVAGNAFIVPLVGTGLAVVIVTIGLLTGSLLIDRFGWFGAKKQPVTGVQIVSLLVMLGGIVLIRI
ncbi:MULTISPECIES: DMT family transporter [unclassified Exiguobacterium]|uniref:DMT family transporter n=1 Tax=unclassified Exiguobacterium TaxID=2644629 RepID=UPI0025BC6E62|nr:MULTISPECIES: DMT family transporter [unclassified Exiguobacterium]